MYILAGKQKLAEARNTTLRQLREKGGGVKSARGCAGGQ